MGWLEFRLPISDELGFWLLIMKYKQISLAIYLLLCFLYLEHSLEHTGRMHSHNVS